MIMTFMTQTVMTVTDRHLEQLPCSTEIVANLFVLGNDTSRRT
jgi:hypothetical protein